MSEIVGTLGGALGGLSGMGTLGAPAGVPTGLAGLFAALLGQGNVTLNGAGLGAGEGFGLGAEGADPLAELLANLETGGEGESEAELLTKLGLPTDGTVTTETVVVQAVLVQLRQTVVELQQAGVKLQGLGDTKELAAALTELGMDPDEAMGKALQIDQMLQLVKSYLGADEDETPGGLLEMIAASSTYLTPLMPDVSSVTVTQTEVTVAAFESTVTTANIAAAKAFSKPVAGVGLARVLTGIDGAVPVTEDVPVALALDKEIDTSLADVPVELGDEVVEASLPVEAVVKVDTPAAVTAVAAAIPDVAKAVTPKHEKKEEPKVDNLTRTGTVVEPSKVVSAPAGTEVLRVLPEVEGSDGGVAERKLDAATLRTMNPEPAGPTTSPTLDAGTQAEMQGLMAKSGSVDEVKTAPTFAERLATATRSEVTHQAVVQVRNVIDSGGGTVRMILNPPELGEIRIEMIISNGKVEGSISATDNAVVELLARDVHSLKQGLADAGLKLGDQGLALMLNNSNQQGSQNQQGQHAQAGNQNGHNQLGSDEALAAEMAAQDAANWIAPDKLVDVRI